MKKWSSLAWLVLSILFSVMLPVKPRGCPTCEPGYGLKDCKCVKCEDEEYWSQRNGQPKCNKCTTACTEKKNLIQVTACTKTSDRSCKCKPGYYCQSSVNLTCRRECEPCINGFTKTSNLNKACQQFTNCASLGMVVIKEGSPTADRVCGHSTTRPEAIARPNPTTATPDTPYTTTQRLPHSTQKPHRIQSGNQSVFTTVLQFSSQNPVTSLASETTAPSGVTAEIAVIPGEKEGPVLPSELFSKTTLIVLLLLLVSMGLVLCLSLKCKSRVIKNKLQWAGIGTVVIIIQCRQRSKTTTEDSSSYSSDDIQWKDGEIGDLHYIAKSLALRRHQPMFPAASTYLNMEALSDVTDTVRDQVQGQGSFLGKNQQVTMEHVGKADGINNTVGSIYIYSPGMVILGSNSNEKKEEVETSGEDSGEDTCLMSVPQQESSSEEHFIRLATQEELGKELSIPVPATSK